MQDKKESYLPSDATQLHGNIKPGIPNANNSYNLVFITSMILVWVSMYDLALERLLSRPFFWQIRLCVMTGAEKNTIELFRFGAIVALIDIMDHPTSVFVETLGSFNICDRMTQMDVLAKTKVLGIQFEIFQHFLIVHEVSEFRGRRIVFKGEECTLINWIGTWIGGHFLRRVDYGWFHNGGFWKLYLPVSIWNDYRRFRVVCISKDLQFHLIAQSIQAQVRIKEHGWNKKIVWIG